MSGISARESIRSARPARPTQQPVARPLPPVLFRLPSVAPPAAEPMDHVSADGGAAMTMPAAMATMAASMPMHTPGPSMASAGAAQINATVSPSASISSTDTTTAARTALAQEKAAGKNLLNLLIAILLIAALLVITYISLSSPGSAPGIAQEHDHDHAGDEALATLGELKVPDVSNGTAASAPTSPSSSVNEPEHNVKPSSNLVSTVVDSADASLGNDLASKTSESNSESLISGLDTTGANLPGSTASNSHQQPRESSAAQIQLRTPVPVGYSSSSLADASRSSAPSLSLGGNTSSSTTRVDTVSSPTNVTKSNGTQVFPANPDLANPQPLDRATGDANSNSSNGGASPSLWDGAKSPVDEGLQLGSTSSDRPSQVNISKPLSAELMMPAAHSTTNSLASQSQSSTTTDPGVTVGAGPREPYSLSTPRSTATPDYDDATLARTYAQLKQTNAPTAQEASAAATNLMNSYGANPAVPQPGQNLYVNDYVKASPSGQINSYNMANNVPPGVTGAPSGPFVPATQTGYGMPGTQTPNNQMTGNQVTGNQVTGSLANGPTSAPTSFSGYSIPPVGQRPNQQTAYAQPQGYQPQPQTTQQQTTQQPQQPYVQQQPYGAPAYGQSPAYGQQPAPGGFGPSGSGYPGSGNPGSGYSGSGYPNMSYPTPAGMSPTGQPASYGQPNMQRGANLNRPTGGYQPAASYPVTNAYSSGQGPAGMIGSTGYATTPNGDVTPARPVMGTMGSATSTPYGAP